MKNKLAKHWSPEQISAWLTRTFPDNKAMHACHETIYQAIYVQAKGSLKLEVTRALRTGREVPRVLFLGICLDFHSLVIWVASPKLFFYFC
ncbi:hypothetical protein SAMN05421878_1081, partial [Actinobaculum suis]